MLLGTTDNALKVMACAPRTSRVADYHTLPQTARTVQQEDAICRDARNMRQTTKRKTDDTTQADAKLSNDAVAYAEVRNRVCRETPGKMLCCLTPKVTRRTTRLDFSDTGRRSR